MTVCAKDAGMTHVAGLYHFREFARCAFRRRIGHFQPRLAFEYLARTRDEFGRCHEKTIGIGAWQRQQAPGHFLIIARRGIGAEMQPESCLAGGWTHLVGDMARTEILILMPAVAQEEQAVLRKRSGHPVGKREPHRDTRPPLAGAIGPRSEEHTSELPSLM